MKNRKKFIIGIIIILLVLFWYRGCRQLEFIDAFTKKYETERIIITNDYIKTGWMLRDVSTNWRLAIQKIYPENLVYSDTLEFKDFGNARIKVDSCMVLFGKGQSYFRLWDRSDIIYFHKPNRRWTWDKICDLQTEEVIYKAKTFEFENNQFYRVLSHYWSGNTSYKIYIYVDKSGGIHSFKEPPGKNI